MKKLYLFLALPILCIVSSCSETGASDTDNLNPSEIINSGFEPDTTLYAYNANIFGITGVDHSRATANNWDAANQDASIGNLYFKMEPNASLADRSVSIVNDPLNSNNHVVVLALNRATEPDPLKGRVQFEIGETAGLHDFYFKEKVFLSDGYAKLNTYEYQSGDWISLMEVWGNSDVPSTNLYPFRITLYIIKTKDDKNITLGLQAQSMDTNDWKVIWNQVAENFVLPVNEWFTLEAHCKEGDLTHGKFKIIIVKSDGTENAIFDITNYTYHPQNTNPEGFKWLNPIKLYCSDDIIQWVKANNGSLKVYLDDFELWRNKEL